MSRLPRLLLLVVVAGLVATFPACTREETRKEVLLDIIDATEHLARSFVYVDEADERVQVAGVIEDDFRYKARLSIDGSDVEDEVVHDDALAARFLDPTVLPRFVEPGAGAAIAAAGASSDVAFAALSTRRWVLDPAGAPPVVRTATDRRRQGDDPVFDAITVLQFVRQAVERAESVETYSRDKVNPVYKEREDPFPKPEQGSRTTRYDLRPSKLPRADQARAGGNLPEDAHFRKMVVYVRDGLVIEVREVIDIESKREDLNTIYGLEGDTTAAQVLAGINAVLRGGGSDPIRVRSMIVQFSEIGEPLVVDMPVDAVEGSLALLRYRGGAAAAGQGADQPAA